MTDYVKVQGHNGLVRDMNSSAIINKDTSAYERAVKRAIEAQAKRDELSSATRDINNIKS